jgi:hypothetical protein
MKTGEHLGPLPMPNFEVSQYSWWRPHRDSERVDTDLIIPFAGEVMLTSRWRRAA